MFKFLRIQQKLLLTILGSTIVTLGVSGFFLAQTSSSIIKEHLYANVHSLARDYGAQVGTELQAMVGTSTLLRSLFESADKIRPQDRRALFNATMRKVQFETPLLTATWTTWEKNALDGRDKDFVHNEGSNGAGRFVATWYGAGDSVASQASEEDEVATADWYLIPKQTQKPAILEPSFYSYTGKDADKIFETSYIVPVFGPDKTYIAGVGTDLALSRFWDILAQFHPFERGYALLLSNQGTVIFHPVKEKIGKSFYSDSDQVKQLNSTLGLDKAVAGGKEISFVKPAGADAGEDFWFQFVPVEVPGTSTPWSLAVAIPKAAVETGVTQIQSVFLGVGLFLAVLLTVLIVGISRIITVPLGHLNRNLREIAAGEGDLTRELPVRSGDELGQVSEHFNHFLGFLNGLLVQIQVVIRRNQAISATLAQSIGQSAAAVEQISRNMGSTEGRTERMDGELVKADGELTAVKTFMEQLKGNILEQTALAAESGRAAGQIAATLDSGLAASEEMVRESEGLIRVAVAGEHELDETQAAVAKIGSTTKVISDMLAIIHNITDQTNLLAMNAAIEAAHAGAAGRGFSVVAQEIRKLAEVTSLNAKNISASLEVVVGSINLALANSAQTREEFAKLRRGIDQMAAKLTENQRSMAALRTEGLEISSQLSSLNRASELLTASGDEAETRVVQAAQRLVQLTVLSREARVGMREDTAGLRDIQEHLTTIQSSSHENQEQVEKISQLVNRFRLMETKD